MRLTFANDPLPGPCVLVLGMFDGVHTGHAWLLRTAGEWGALEGLPVAVCTFARHPLAVLRPKDAPPMLSTVLERAQRMAQLGADHLAVLPFDQSVRVMKPVKFVQWLVGRFAPRHVVVGFNYTFGQGGAGDTRLLRKMGRVLGFEVHVVSPVQVGGSVVSSTRVRKLLAQGDVQMAARLLERPYAVCGRVERGKGLGRQIGFPTANVAIPRGKALPAFGIYVARVKTKKGTFPAVASLGSHPTVPEGGITLEAHLLNVRENLYGQRVRVQFLKRLRGEITFPGLAELKDQIARDAWMAKAYFGMK